MNKINIRNLTDSDIQIGEFTIESMRYIRPEIYISTDVIYETYGEMSGQNFLQNELINYAWRRIVDITIIHILGEELTGDVYIVYKDSIFKDVILRTINESYCANKIELIPLQKDKVHELTMDTTVRFKLNKD
jgi:hypothetical protein